MARKTKGIEQLKSGLWAVVDLTKPFTTFSKVLTGDEEKEFKKTGKLPYGVTKKTAFSPLAIVESHNTAVAMKNGEKPIYPDKNFGIFSSYGQVKKIKKILSAA